MDYDFGLHFSFKIFLPFFDKFIFYFFHAYFKVRVFVFILMFSIV